MDNIIIQSGPFDPVAEISRLIGADASQGAVTSFIGMMRDINEGDAVTGMYLEHYPGMTEKALQNIINSARSRWSLGAVTVAHRVGRLEPTDPIVLVAVTSQHRGEAFDACEFIIDYLKTKAPFWKKEVTMHGERWVDARESDKAAMDNWHKTST